MFNLSEWLVTGIIAGYASGQNSFARTTELSAAYLSKGLISTAQAEKIGEACPAPEGSPEEEAVQS